MTTFKRTLGTCYYPEHWPQEIWPEDARRMANAGLTWVRIGEFAWSRLEPTPGHYDFGWLDTAIATLGKAGLQVVLGTPTATPPRWMIEKHPDMLPVDADGRVRKFGSRRHYCFSHAGYRKECVTIATELARRYGQNPHVAAWQTDNEYGCHDTTLSYSPAARDGFRAWLAKRYECVDALNAAWGNVFWSMEYASFEQIDLPNLTVTEPNPAHMLAFRRYSSDQVAAFNRCQVEAIRAHSDRPIAHNYMGKITNFDHFQVGADLDIASWDSYPLGFLEDRLGASAAHKRAFCQQGDPDFQAFHHDLYRAVGRGRWWVMEQQPGPVNWAPYNPAPLPGMVRLWTWEAFAHGAEAVCYFRWRQAPFAQEQMHAGLLRPDGADAPGLEEARHVAQELAEAPDGTAAMAPVALMFDYDSDFAWSTQPQGRAQSYFGLVFDTYRALRTLGLSVDIIPPTQRDFSGYRIVAVPGMVHMPDPLKQALASGEAHVVLGPRSANRDLDMTIPVPLPPNFPGLDITVARVETLPPDLSAQLENGGAIIGYRETLEGHAEVIERTLTGDAAVVRQGNITYLAGHLDREALPRLLGALCASLGIETHLLPDGVRIRDTAHERFWFNYSTREHEVAGQRLAPTSFVRRKL